MFMRFGPIQVTLILAILPINPINTTNAEKRISKPHSSVLTGRLFRRPGQQGPGWREDAVLVGQEPVQ